MFFPGGGGVGGGGQGYTNKTHTSPTARGDLYGLIGSTLITIVLTTPYNPLSFTPTQTALTFKQVTSLAIWRAIDHVYMVIFFHSSLIW